MKNIIILPGFSPLNREQLDKYSSHFRKEGYKVNAIEWPHWESGNKNDFVKEEQIKKLIGLVNMIQGKITFIAKSVGTIILSEVIKRIGVDKVESAILLGLPLGENPDELLDVYKSLNTLQPNKITIIQAKNDPYASFDIVKNFMENSIGNKKVKLMKIDRDDHIYPFESVEKYLKI